LWLKQSLQEQLDEQLEAKDAIRAAYGWGSIKHTPIICDRIPLEKQDTFTDRSMGAEKRPHLTGVEIFDGIQWEQHSLSQVAM
jgi:hypothetical protein